MAEDVSRLGGLRSAYVHTATQLLTCVLFFAILNLALGVVAFMWTRAHPGPLSVYGTARVMAAYAGWEETDVVQLLRDTWSNPDRFAPFVNVKAAPFESRYVNVSPAGFRLGQDQAPWPPVDGVPAVFLFGGSTMWGVGAPDAETIPSFLQQTACGRRIAVYNFGQSTYISTQEMLLFHSLVGSGRVPSVAVFMDGLNDFDGTDLLDQERAAAQWNRNPWWSAMDSLPVVRAAGRVRRFFKPGTTALGAVDRDDRGAPSALVARWLANKRMIEALASAFHVQPVFVIQPVPSYKYDISRHFLGSTVLERHHLGATEAYPLLATRRLELESGGNVLWLADVQDGRRENFYVDEVHYTSAFNREIAERIAAFLEARSLLPCGAPSVRR
jgi:hypothetical protein